MNVKRLKLSISRRFRVIGQKARIASMQKLSFFRCRQISAGISK